MAKRTARPVSTAIVACGPDWRIVRRFGCGVRSFDVYVNGDQFIGSRATEDEALRLREGYTYRRAA